MDNRYKKFPFIGGMQLLDAHDFKPYGVKLYLKTGSSWVSNGKEWIEVE